MHLLQAQGKHRKGKAERAACLVAVLHVSTMNTPVL